MIFQVKSIARLLAAATLISLVSCGGASSNDQGVSFTLDGFATACTGDTTVPNLSGLSVPLSPTGSTEPDATDVSGFRSGAIGVGYVLQNRLARQFIRTQQAFLTYYIPGAVVQPPSTTVVLGVFMERAEVNVLGTDGGTGGSNGIGQITDIIDVTPTTGCGETAIVTAEVRQWMVLNRNSLPEPPFTMEVNAHVTGLTSAGDRLDTNPASMFVQFTPDVTIEPGEGTDATGDAAAGDVVDTGSDITETGTDTPTEGTDTSTDSGDSSL